MDKDIDRIPKNPDTDIVIRVDDFGGKRGVTIREFVKSERYTGFTKAGTRIPADKFAIFKQAINTINEKELMEAVESAPMAESGIPANPEDNAQKKFSSGKRGENRNPTPDVDIEDFAM